MKNLSEFLKNLYITEMAIHLGEFRTKSEGIINQIIENWCLVKWCDLNPDNDISKRLRNHWTSELNSVMIKISNMKLKCGRKDKALKNLIIDTLEYNDSTNIAIQIRDKFNEEGLSKYVNQMSEICSKHINEICNVLLYDKYKIEEYINGYLG